MTAKAKSEDVKAGDDLDALMGREVVLGYGFITSGKSYSVAKLVEQGQVDGFNVVVLDRDRGIAKAIKEVFGAKRPENLDYFLINKWEKLNEGVRHAFDVLGPGDWLVTEMIGRFWDFAQTEYSRQVYGEELSQHILTLRVEAEELLRKAGISQKSASKDERSQAAKTVSQKLGYGGLEGRTDWALIKRMHNDDVFDHIIIDGPFNVFATSSVKTPFDPSELEKWPTIFRGFGRMPEGEKNQIHRFDTIAYLEQVAGSKGETYRWRTDLKGHHKDRGGRPAWKGIDFTGVGFIESYLNTVRAWESGESVEQEAEE